MKIKSTKFTGLKIIQSKKYRDSRGFFKEDYTNCAGTTIFVSPIPPDANATRKDVQNMQPRGCQTYEGGYRRT